MKNNNENEQTLLSYDSLSQEYIDEVYQDSQRWVATDEFLQRAVDGLDKSSKIFEFGSGRGDDARYLQDLGYRVEVSDAATPFVEFLNNSSFEARQFNVLTDEFPKNYDLIFANYVLQHVTAQQLETVVDKVFRSLLPGGRFAFFLGEGEGEGWGEDQAGRSFYWCFWSQEALGQTLEKAGFHQIDISKQVDYGWAVWLSAVAQKPA